MQYYGNEILLRARVNEDNAHIAKMVHEQARCKGTGVGGLRRVYVFFFFFIGYRFCSWRKVHIT